MKVLTILALAVIIAGCSVGATTPSIHPLPSIGESSPSMSASTLPSVDGSATTAACTDAFANIDAESIIAMGRLDAVADQLDSTILACSSADAWEAAAETALPGLDISDPRAFLAARCEEATTLAGAALCMDVGS